MDQLPPQDVRISKPPTAESSGSAASGRRPLPAGSPRLSVAAVGRELGKSPAAVVRLIRSGQLGAYRVGRTYRVSPADFEAYIERARVRLTPMRAEHDRQALAHLRHSAAERQCARFGL
jgi:excisionase family DNA binding protein